MIILVQGETILNIYSYEGQILQNLIGKDFQHGNFASRWKTVALVTLN